PPSNKPKREATGTVRPTRARTGRSVTAGTRTTWARGTGSTRDAEELPKGSKAANHLPVYESARVTSVQLGSDRRNPLDQNEREVPIALLRKEVIQPHLPVRLPCYDFTPITDPTFDGSLLKGWATGFGWFRLL